MIVRPLKEPGWSDWVASRPPIIQEMCRSHPPDRLYLLNTNRVTIYSYHEDGTVTVEATGEYNRILFSRKVFGVPLGDLTECDPLPSGSDVGDTCAEAGYTEKDIREIIIPKLAELIGVSPNAVKSKGVTS